MQNKENITYSIKTQYVHLQENTKRSIYNIKIMQIHESECLSHLEYDSTIIV